jgi:hypothetical protein
MAPPKGYQQMASNENDVMTKERLGRKIDRDIRDLSLMPSSRILRWLVKSSWIVILLQSIYACVNVYLNVVYDWSVCRNVLGIQEGSRPPFLLGTLQFISAFMTGLALNDAIARFKISMTCLLGFKKSLESLRIQLLAGTTDSKLETSVQTLLALAVVLLSKEVAFFTEDFDEPIRSIVKDKFRPCILFSPEVLWTFDRHHWQFLFNDFVTHSWMSDPEGRVMSLYKEMVECWKQLEDLFTVRAPRTSTYIGRLYVQSFFVLVPLMFDDLTTQVMTPFVATMFTGMMELANELADPWDSQCTNSVPLTDTLRYLACPVDTERCDDDHVADGIHWLNRGLSEGSWNSDTPDSKFPRIKHNYPNVGKELNFQLMRTIPDMVNRNSWQEFVRSVSADMDAAQSRGRRMPGYLRQDAYEHGPIF